MPFMPFYTEKQWKIYIEIVNACFLGPGFELPFFGVSGCFRRTGHFLETIACYTCCYHNLLYLLLSSPVNLSAIHPVCYPNGKPEQPSEMGA